MQRKIDDLHQAIATNNLTKVQEIISDSSEQVENLFASKKDDHTPLALAVVSGYVNIVSYLISQGANYCLKTSNGNSLLHEAAALGHADVVKVLIKAGTKLYPGWRERFYLGYNSQNLTALELAIQNNYFEVANLLFTDIPTEAYLGLHDAVANNELDIVKKLFANFGMDADRWKNQSSKIQTQLNELEAQLERAEKKRDKIELKTPGHNVTDDRAIAEITASMNELKANKEKLLERKWYISLHESDQKTVSRLYELKKKFIENHNFESHTVLRVAVTKGFADVASYLLQQGADYSFDMGEGNTLLHEAVSKGHTDVVEVLLKYISGYRTCANMSGVTPMEMALQKGDFKTAAVLVDPASKMTDILNASRYAAALKKSMPEYVKKYISSSCQNDSEFPAKVWGQMQSLYLADIRKPASPVHGGLYVSECNLKDAHVIASLQRLPNEINDTIKVLDLSNNQLSKDSAQAIAQFLVENKTLTSLDLSGNPLLGDGGYIIDSGIQIIAQSFEAHLSLEVINLANTGLNDYDVKAIAKALSRNDMVTILDISGNPNLTDGLAWYLDNMLQLRGKSASLKVILEPNPQLSSSVVKKYRRIGKATRRMHDYMLALPLLAGESKSTDRVRGIIQEQTKKLIYSICDNIHFFEYEDASNVINPRRKNMQAWLEFAKTEFEVAGDLEMTLQALDKIVSMYWFLRHHTTYETSLPREKDAFHALDKLLQDAHCRLRDVNKEYYWELNADKSAHKQAVLAMVKNDLCKTFQLYKTTSRSLSSQLFHRADIAPGEHLLSMVKHVAHLLPFVTHTLGIVYEGAEAVDEMVQHLPELLENAEHSSELLERLPFISDGIHFLKHQVDKITGKERIEKRLAQISGYFSGIEAKARSERLAEEIVHYYQEQIIMLTTYDARNFAKAISGHIQCFLLKGSSDVISGSELMDWIIKAPSHGSKNVQLHNDSQSLVLLSDLLQRPGLKLLRENGEEINFDFKFKGADEKMWLDSDGGTYGYRVADEKLLAAIQDLLQFYVAYEYESDDRYYAAGMIALKVDTIKMLLNDKLKCIPVNHETVHDLVKRQGFEIKALEKQNVELAEQNKTLKSQMDELTERFDKLVDLIMAGVRLPQAAAQHDQAGIDPDATRRGLAPGAQH